LTRGQASLWLSLLAFSVRNWFVSWTFFLPSFLINLTGMVTSAAIYYLMGQMVGKAAGPHIAEYGLNYGTYIVTGVMFTLMMDSTLGAYHEALLRAYWTNQFDVYLQHPGGVSALLAGEVIAKYMLAGLNTMVYFLLAVWLFGVPVKIANLPDTLATLVLAVLSLTGLGLAGASTFSLFNVKREETNPIQLIVTLCVTLLSGIYFPATVLPRWMQRVAQWLPHTHALRAARLCLSGQARLSDPLIRGDLVFLIQFALITLPIGVALFAAGIRLAEKEGNLTRWS
jgi:ABC-2 type transport system permease protein